MTPHWLWTRLKELCLPNVPHSALVEAVSFACVAGESTKAFERIEYFTPPYNTQHVIQALATAASNAPGKAQVQT
jgi:hypothetical protein